VPVMEKLARFYNLGVFEKPEEKDKTSRSSN
jgi:hypothetical protein